VTLDDYDRFCAALPATSHVVQWGDAHVWKVGGKVFAVGRDDGEGLQVSFKVSPMSYEMLKDEAGLRPAPYLASRGMSWIQRFSDESMPDEVFCDYLRESHRLVAAGLTKRLRGQLGLG
jgi:predicted DNA-binding protein (MmcQ/YjbR family)